MDDKIDEAIRRGLDTRRAQAALKQAADTQSVTFWLKLKSAVERGVEKINQSPESTGLAGSTLVYAIKSETEFSVENKSLPGRTITIRNCTAFLNIAVEIRTWQGHSQPTKTELEGNEEIHFKMNDDTMLFVQTADNGRKFYDANELAVYVLEKFWSSELKALAPL